MAICMDYIKGGEVLIAPRLDYKYQYLLKCSECEELYCFLRPFVEHCGSHYDRDTTAEKKCPTYTDCTEDDIDVSHNDSTFDAETFEGLNIKIEPQLHIKDQDPLTNTKEDSVGGNDEVDFKQIMESNDSNNTTCSVDCNSQEEDVNMKYAEEEYEDDDEETMSEYNESDNSDETDVSQSSTTSTSIRNFMKCDKNLATIIEAYKTQPKLWNYNLTAQVKPIPDRLKCIKKIAAVLQNKLNVRLTSKQVSRIIIQLRHKYRVQLENEKLPAKRGTIHKKSKLIESLSFLKPFMESISIAVLDSHANDLAPEQIVQLVDIYKRYPQLWKSDTMEYCCKSKRDEAFALLKNDIEVEMDLEVEEDSLKKYFRCVHVYFSKQKRRDMTNNKTKVPRFEFYDHMMYLYNHVGPFKCSYCARLFNGPLQLQAHRYDHEGSFSLKCPECKKGFKSVEPYVAHVRRHMNDLGAECNICGKGFLRTADLDIHMRAHTGAKPFFCDICGSSFRHSQAFKVHRRRHEKQHSHFCPVCAKGCYTKNELNNHMRTHKDVREFECGICGKAFKTKKTMQQHTFIHEEGRNHICPLCGRGYKNKIGLGHHIKTHSKNNNQNCNLSSIFTKDYT